MMKLILIDEDGKMKTFDDSYSFRDVLEAIKQGDIETIVAGATNGGVVLWEKQFKTVIVMPTQFGGKK